MTRTVTVKNVSFTESVINRSRFIGQCFPASSEEEALALLAGVRAAYPDASHTCYAYRIGERAETTRFSDAGEPGGTAGTPILEVLKANGVTDALCTVTRYFGGILLGRGGLVRAYSGAAAQALQAAGRVERIPARVFVINMEYPRFGALEGLIREKSSVDAIEYTDIVSVRTRVTAQEAEGFAALVIEKSDGRVVPEDAGDALVTRDI